MAPSSSRYMRFSATEIASTTRSQIVSGWPTPLRSTISWRRRAIGVLVSASTTKRARPGAALIPNPMHAWGGASSPVNEDRDLAVGDDLDALAPQHEGCHTLAAVRRHENQVAALLGGRLDDGVVRVIPLDVHRVTGHARALGRGGAD